MKTIISHFENGLKTFEGEDEFISFMQGIFEENEEIDSDADPIKSYYDALEYLFYCDNWEFKGFVK